MLNHTQSYKRRNTSATTININEYDGSQSTETKIHLLFFITPWQYPIAFLIV